MQLDRRDFLKKSGVFASSLALTPWAVLGNELSLNGSIPTFGLQLYTLRDDLPKDPKGILKQIASFGYKQIEGYEGPSGLWWGLGAKEFKKYVDSLGLSMVSSHCDTEKDFDKKCEEAANVGLKYLLSPWVGPQKTIDDYKKLADHFNKLGETCKKHGIRFAYHNHDYSFKKIEGQIPQDIFMKGTDASLVDFEIDMYWVVTAGEDPITWMKKHPNRFKLCHVKDRSKTALPSEGDASVDLGTGKIDYKSILKQASALGMKYFIVEQEKYEGTTPLKSAAVDAAWLKNLKY
jgi:hypothetical protein